ncbi:hypothetical protein [Konateibacter massiliensis]|uniref:hypothetical protein n=1 Tax=Konateibacter massiliensis TaxID=2002841 RepID=UPI000C14E5C2|nr:hypothetical protein [Konateibacter massiliensis]
MAIDFIGSSLTKSFTKSFVEETMVGGGAIKGDPGENGKSAYEIAVLNGFEGTESDWLESIKGTKGQDGIYVVSMNISEDNNITAILSNGNTIPVGSLSTIKGERGEAGTTPRIDDTTGRWFIGDYDTGYVAVPNTIISFNDLTDIPTIPTALSQLTNDENFIKNTVTNLLNYYSKNEVYTKNEVTNLVSNINKLTTLIVEELPTIDISPTTIYLMSAGESVYNQYMYISNSWANLGSTNIDLQEYITTSQLQSALNEKSNTNHTHEELHTHGNLPLLETITTEMIQSWNKHFSGNYNDLTNKPSLRMAVLEWQSTTSYIIGDLVWINNTTKRCNTNHLSSTSFETDASYWDNVGGGGGVPQLKEISGQVTVAAGDSSFLHLNTGFNKYDIRTLYISNSSNENISVEIYNKSTDGLIIYESLEASSIQDIANTPCEDKDNSESIHIKFNNKGTSVTSIDYFIYVTNLL